jgi:hypothetical protein
MCKRRKLSFILHPEDKAGWTAGRSTGWRFILRIPSRFWQWYLILRQRLQLLGQPHIEFPVRRCAPNCLHQDYSRESLRYIMTKMKTEKNAGSGPQMKAGFISIFIFFREKM